MNLDYSDYGVDTLKASQLVEWLKRQNISSVRFQKAGGKVLTGIGGFSALFQAHFPGMSKPCIACSVDGVGTKLKLAVQFNSYKEVGQDLVAMCVNDLICSGAKPLFFMDYYSCTRLEKSSFQEFLKGVLSACRKSKCLLLGGETAEMPDCYTKGDFDCAGFALGVVDKSKRLKAEKVRSGDLLIGVSSSGFHSNGFSLLRKVFQKDIMKWKDILLKPTALYVSLAEKILKRPGLKAMAHITGGGLDNIVRILPPYSCANLKPWSVPSPFLEVKKRTGMKWPSLLKTLNCGIGLVLVVSKRANLEPIHQAVKASGFSSIDLGCVQAQKQKKPSWSLSFDRLSSV